MKTKHINYALSIIFITLIILFIALIIISAKSPKFDWIIYLSGSSTFAIAILTIVYVATTRSQLGVMSRQLSEMQKDRELQNQPLPWPMELKVYTERPCFFFSPPNNYEATSRHHILFELKNIGSTPALSIDVCCNLIIPDNKKFIMMDAVSVRIDVLEVEGGYPSNNEERDAFLFPEDAGGRLLSCFLETDIDKFPLVEIHIFYRNILGACFYLSRAYKLYPKKESNELIKSWLERLNTFPIRYKESIESLSKNELGEKEESAFEDLKRKCIEGLDDEENEYVVWPIPAIGGVNCINLDEYRKATEKLSYGVLTMADSTCQAVKD